MPAASFSESRSMRTSITAPSGIKLPAATAVPGGTGTQAKARSALPAAIEFGEQLHQLCAGTLGTFDLSIGIAFTCTTVQEWLPQAIAMQLHIVANELITNAVRHAFPARRGGRIAIFFHVPDTAWQLSVEHSGLGLGARGYPAPRLSKMLVTRMGGQLEMRTVIGGMVYIATVPRT